MPRPRCARSWRDSSRDRRVELAERLGQQQLAEEPRELLSLVGVEGDQQPLLVREVIDDRGIDELAAALVQADQATAPVGRVGQPFHQAHPLQTIETVRHRAR